MVNCATSHETDILNNIRFCSDPMTIDAFKLILASQKLNQIKKSSNTLKVQ